jgi:protoheme IX farnesyltransferase
MIGWAAVTGGIDAGSVALFAIIFLWTPPHSWALALFRQGDYEAAGVPMLPVVAGVRETKRQMLLYTVALVPATLLPVAIGISGAFYASAAAFLGFFFAHHMWRVWKDEDGTAARPMFFFSIVYLFLIFMAMLVDRLMFLPMFKF